MLSCLKEPKPSRRQLREENLRLRESMDHLHQEFERAVSLSNELEKQVDRFQKENSQLAGQVEQFRRENINLGGQIEEFRQENSHLSRTIGDLSEVNNSLEEHDRKQVDHINRLEKEITRLIEQNEQTETSLTDLKKMVHLFGNNVVDIEEKLFKTYYEYKAENKVQHHNNILQIFISCDADRDGLLNEIEFGLFSDYVDKLYKQKVSYKGDPMSIDDILELNIRYLV